ncbi:hypothetical protein D3C71_25010 [compost metagenome]
MLSYAAQYSNAQRAVLDLRHGVPGSAKKVDDCNRLAGRAVDHLMELLSAADPAEVAKLKAGT